MRMTLTRDQAARLLGVTPGAGPDEARAAWRRFARTTHPDRGGDASEFRRGREALDLLLLHPRERGHAELPSDDERPHGSDWLDVNAVRGLSWPAFCVLDGVVATVHFFTISDGRRFETMPAAGGLPAGCLGVWQHSLPGDDFANAALRACRALEAPGSWMIAAPPRHRMIGAWSQDVLDERLARRQLRLDERTGREVGARLARVQRAFSTGEIDFVAAGRNALGIVARVHDAVIELERHQHGTGTLAPSDH